MLPQSTSPSPSARDPEDNRERDVDRDLDRDRDWPRGCERLREEPARLRERPERGDLEEPRPLEGDGPPGASDGETESQSSSSE
mmetsp:Transcript_33622/g.85575  ORF Transcript_33622/g.85575 Transcript_33622/m.85575 type:complete len:84 (+) Transcript_33622:39-290(+)